MGDQPITLSVLAQFHRDVILPDVERVVRSVVDTAISDLRNDFSGHFDALYERLDRLESEYQMMVAGLRRIEEHLDALEKGLGALAEAQQKMALRSEVESLKGRVDSMQAQIRAIEARLTR